jgi:hypothetical protein
VDIVNGAIVIVAPLPAPGGADGVGNLQQALIFDQQKASDVERKSLKARLSRIAACSACGWSA